MYLKNLITPLLVASALSMPAFAQEDAAGGGRDEGGGAQAPDTSVAAEALQATLYDVIALRYQVQQAHWNVVGEDFYQLHDITGDFYEALNGLVDGIGEQRLALGKPSTAVVSSVARNADLPEMPAGYISAGQLIEALTASYTRLAGNLAERIAEVGESGDLVSQDRLIGVAAMINKQRWLISTHAKTVDD